MTINRVYFLGKDYLSKLDKTLGNIDIDYLNNSTTLYDIKKYAKTYDYSDYLNTNNTIYRHFYELIRDIKDRVPLHESLFVFDLELDYRKEYYSNTYEGFITFDIIKHEIVNKECTLNSFTEISPLIHDLDVFKKEYVRDIVFFINFLELNNIHYLLTNIDSSVHQYQSNLHEIVIQNIN